MKIVYLHIGRHKSGTSSLQRFLFSNRELLKKQSIIYPLTGLNKKVAHHPLADIFKCRDKENKLKDIKTKFDDEVSGFEKIIISSEAFQQVNNLNQIKDFFGDYKIVTVVYFREILDYLQSAYAQSVHNTNISEDFESFALRTNLNYEHFYQRWDDMSDDTIVRYFDRQHLFNGDVIDDFCKQLGINKDILLPLDGEDNPSIGGNLLYFKRQLNDAGVNSSKMLYRQLSTIAASDNKNYSNGFHISDDFAHKLRSKQKQNNEFLVKIFGNISLKSFEHRGASPDSDSYDLDKEFFLTELSNQGFHFVDLIKKGETLLKNLPKC